MKKIGIRNLGSLRIFAAILGAFFLSTLRYPAVAKDCRYLHREALALEQRYTQALEAGDYARLQALKSEKEKIKRWMIDCAKEDGSLPSQETEEVLSSIGLSVPSDKKKPGQRDTWLSLKWNPHFRDFYQNVIKQIYKSPEFRGIRLAALWQEFWEPSKRLHDYMSRHSEIREGKLLDVLARVWFDPEKNSGELSDGNFFIVNAESQDGSSETAFPKQEPIMVPSWTSNPPLPWTKEMLSVWKRQEMEGARTDEDREDIERTYFIGEQVVKNWDRYGNWYPPSDEWSKWFNNQMGPLKFSGFSSKILFKSCISHWNKKAKVLQREATINPYGAKKNRKAVRYEILKSELDSRDPTSIAFSRHYKKFVDESNPNILVDPPKHAQKVMLKYSKILNGKYVEPMTTEELKAEFKRMKKILGLPTEK